MPHYSRFLFPQRKEGSKAQGTVGRLKACLSYSLTQTPLNANSSGMQTDNVSPHKGVAEFSKIFETFSFFALPNPGNTVSLLDSLKCKLSTSLAPPASFFQPPRWAWLKRIYCLEVSYPRLSPCKKGRNNFPFPIPQKPILPRCF